MLEGSIPTFTCTLTNNDLRCIQQCLPGAQNAFFYNCFYDLDGDHSILVRNSQTFPFLPWTFMHNPNWTHFFCPQNSKSGVSTMGISPPLYLCVKYAHHTAPSSSPPCLMSWEEYAAFSSKASFLFQSGDGHQEVGRVGTTQILLWHSVPPGLSLPGTKPASCKSPHASQMHHACSVWDMQAQNVCVYNAHIYLGSVILKKDLCIYAGTFLTKCIPDAPYMHLATKRRCWLSCPCWSHGQFKWGRRS